MERLFSPWRSHYIESFVRTPKSDGPCVLCAAAEGKDDDANLIVMRGTHSYVIMNRYPYNSGHVMVVPYRHVPSITDLDASECSEVMQLFQRMMKALSAVSKPDGYNLGSNIGRTAGAGIDSHVHFHIVPRWNGDTNFLPVLADTKTISEDIEKTLRKLRAALASA